MKTKNKILFLGKSIIINKNGGYSVEYQNVHSLQIKNSLAASVKSTLNRALLKTEGREKL